MAGLDKCRLNIVFLFLRELQLDPAWRYRQNVASSTCGSAPVHFTPGSGPARLLVTPAVSDILMATGSGTGSQPSTSGTGLSGIAEMNSIVHKPHP